MNSVNSVNAPPLIIGHRGASAWAPENTLAAFRLALEAGADGIELDVRLAKDGVPVVIHDADLRRTGLRNARVADLSSSELGGADVGSWFNAKYPLRARPEFADETIPTLAQVMELADRLTGPFFIELKFDGEDVIPLVSAVCSLLAETAISKKVIVKSFRLDAIATFRRLLPGVAAAALFEPTAATLLRPYRMIDAADEAGASHISLHRSLARPRLVRLAREAGLEVIVWTVDSARWNTRAMREGVFALVTNDPAELRVTGRPGGG